MNKIMIFIPSLEYGGAERVSSYIANYLANEYQVDLVTIRSGADKEYVLSGKVCRHIANGIIETRNVVKKIKPDLIIIMFAPMAITVVPAIHDLSIPYIISERNDPNNFAGKKITKILYQKMMKNADGLVFQTKDAQKYYDGKVKGLTRIIYNPLHLKDFPEPYFGKREKEIVNVGRLHYQKNQKLLIDAFSIIEKEYPEYILKIYGEGDLREELKKYIIEKKVEDKVHLMGNRIDVLELERKASVFVLSSDFEGMPNALIEAMALGMPVISTDCPCGGAKELIMDHENGLLVPINDLDALIEALRELLDNNELRAKVSSNAIQIRTLLDEEKILCQWKEFCNIVVEKRFKSIR